MFPSLFSSTGKVAWEGTETERKFVKLLVDENVQVLSSFQLNQIASLTYGDTVCDQVVEILNKVMSDPLNHSPLCLQKSLVVSKHCLVYGSEDFVQEFWPLGRHVNALQEFNTVLLAQQRGTPDAWWQRVKGGGVDKGLPVREAAKEVLTLLQSKEQLQLQRHTKADPNALVPVGSSNAAFVSDEVRHFMLQKRIDEELGRQRKSNLAKAEGGYGGGYQAKDGKTVVGAAHSVEEMMAAAKREKKRFTDDGPPSGYKPPGGGYGVSKSAAPASSDLLDMSEPTEKAPASTAGEVDLLSFSSPDSTSKDTGISTDPFFAPTASTDLLGMPPPSSAGLATTTKRSEDLLGMGSPSASGPALGEATIMMNALNVAPIASEEKSEKDTSSKNGDLLAVPPSLPNDPSPSIATKKPIMGSNRDRFSALDDLVAIKSSNSPPTGSAEDAMNRILGGESGAKSLESLDTLKSQGTPAPVANSGSSSTVAVGMNSGPAPSGSAEEAMKRVLGGDTHGNASERLDMGKPTLATPADATAGFSMGTVGGMISSAPAAPLVNPDSTLKMGATYGPAITTEDEEDTGFGMVMGGMSGSGLQPTGPPPPTPPPPPPP